MAKRAFCPICQADVALTWEGKVMRHGQKTVNGKRVGDPCKGTGRLAAPYDRKQRWRDTRKRSVQ